MSMISSALLRKLKLSPALLKAVKDGIPSLTALQNVAIPLELAGRDNAADMMLSSGRGSRLSSCHRHPPATTSSLLLRSAAASYQGGSWRDCSTSSSCGQQPATTSSRPRRGATADSCLLVPDLARKVSKGQ